MPGTANTNKKNRIRAKSSGNRAQSKKAPIPVKVFISHSSKDASLTKLIVELLKTSGLKDEEIRCTSVPGYGVMLGQAVATTLRNNIEECEIIIAVLTKQALQSFNVLLELGAGWGFDKILIPVLGPGVEVSDLPSWIRDPHSMKWDNRPCWQSFEGLLRKYLGRKIEDKRYFNRIIDQLIGWNL